MLSATASTSLAPNTRQRICRRVFALRTAIRSPRRPASSATPGMEACMPSERARIVTGAPRRTRMASTSALRSIGVPARRLRRLALPTIAAASDCARSGLVSVRCSKLRSSSVSGRFAAISPAATATRATTVARTMKSACQSGSAQRACARIRAGWRLSTSSTSTGLAQRCAPWPGNTVRSTVTSRRPCRSNCSSRIWRTFFSTGSAFAAPEAGSARSAARQAIVNEKG